jgi:hypothetical protein
VRHIVTLVLVVASAVFAGCGGSTGPPTTTVANGTTVAADRYLADTAAAAEAVRAFAATLSAVPAPATPERLKAIVPQLDPPLTRAKLAGQRLSAEVLADRRLDEQRSRGAVGYASAITAMERVRNAAATGDATTTQSAATALRQAVTALAVPANEP